MNNMIRMDDVKKARIIFRDHQEFTDEEIVGFLHIAEKLFDSSLSPDSLMAIGIDYILSQMKDEEQFIMKERFIQNKTLFEIASITNRSREGVRQIELRCLKYLRKNLEEISMEKYLKMHEVVSKIKIGEIPQNEISIRVL